MSQTHMSKERLIEAKTTVRNRISQLRLRAGSKFNDSKVHKQKT